MLSTAFAAAREVVASLRERDRHRPHPPTEGLVIEVGSGQAAHPRSDLLLEKYVADAFERDASGVYRRGDVVPLDSTRPLVVADGERLPLKDGVAAYAIASHVLEHAPRPDVFAGELSRVARAGFVQVPSRLAEVTYGWPFHPWLIELDRGVLVFRPREHEVAPAGEFFHDDFSASALHRLWWSSRRSAFHLSVEWHEELRVEVGGESRAARTASFDLGQTIEALEVLDRSNRLIPPPDSFRALLCCPWCRADLAFEREESVCGGCGRSFPVVGGVPVLVHEAAA